MTAQLHYHPRLVMKGILSRILSTSKDDAAPEVLSHSTDYAGLDAIPCEGGALSDGC
jgi:hypothetical protein